MKLLINKNTYTASNFKMCVSDDLKTVEAWSYGHWQFIHTDLIGNIYFNDVNYSSSTNGHQATAWHILHKLGIDVHVTTHHVRQNYSPRNLLEAEISALESINKNLQAKIDAPRTWKRKNAERAAEIKQNEYRIKDLVRIRYEFIDKKPIPIQRDKLKPIEYYWSEDCGFFYHPSELEPMIDYTWPVDEDGYADYDKEKIDIITGWEPKYVGFEAPHSDLEKHAKVMAYSQYFRKQNGKLQTDQFTKFLYNVGRLWDVPYIDNIKSLKPWLGVKGGESIEFILLYDDAKDIPGMLPDQDSKDGVLLKRWLAKHKDHPKNVYLIEKLHTYLVNKMNRKEYTPKEPDYFPVNEKFLALEGTEKLRLIKTDQQLRAEGRRQSHCIGSRSYMNQCRNGYHALNYKDYTFFLDPELNLIETHGSHNRPTPSDVVEELESLIKAA